MKSVEKLLYLSAVFFLFISGYYITKLFTDSDTTAIEYSTDMSDMKGGRFVRVVFIGGSDCYYCDDVTHESVELIKQQIRRISHESGLKFTSTGVSTDFNVYTGWNYLQSVGVWDEVIAGSGWYNSGLFRYNWETFEHQASTPQLLITISDYSIVSTPEGSIEMYKDESLITRVVGRKDLIEFRDKIFTDITELQSHILAQE